MSTGSGERFDAPAEREPGTRMRSGIERHRDLADTCLMDWLEKLWLRFSVWRYRRKRSPGRGGHSA